MSENVDSLSARQPLLVTKLFAPPTPAGLVPRPRLVARLDTGIHRRLTLIVAPAGFGKTTLVSEWRASSTGSQLPLAWLSLDEGDNELTRFWSYIVAALRRVIPELDDDSLAHIDTLQPSSFETMLTSVLNKIAAFPRDFALVLDDYHTIQAQPIHDGVAFLLEHLPPCMHLVFLSRADPPLPIDRLRGRGQVTDLRSADLRFTEDEATALLNQVMGLELSAENVTALEARTEGWAVGLQLAALSLQRRKDVSEFIAAFTGSDCFVLHYLIEEVFLRQTQSMQRFLLETSILSRLSASLCDVVTGAGESQKTLDALVQANLFIVPLDEEGCWYRYHTLFADLLRHRLEHTQPAMVPELHRRAAVWFEENGFLREALEHALAGTDYERAVNLVERVASKMLSRSETVTLLRWLNALPPELRQARPRLCIFHAWANVWTMHLETAEACLDDAERAIGALPAGPETQALQGEAVGIRACIAKWRVDLQRSIDLSRRAIDMLPEGFSTLRGALLLNLGAAHWMQDNLVEGTRMAAEATIIAQQIDDLPLAVRAISILGNMRIVQGKLHEALRLYQQGLHLAEERGASALPCSVFPNVGMSLVLFERNDLEGAARYLNHGIEDCKQGENPEFLRLAYGALAHVELVRGNVKSAVDLIAKAERVPRVSARNLFTPEPTVRVLLWLKQGNLDEAVQWAQQSGLSADGDITCMDESSLPAFVRVHLAQARTDPTNRALRDARRLVDRMLRIAEDAGRNGSVIQILVLQALILNAQHDTGAALRVLQRALVLAEPEGYVRVFVGADSSMLDLLRLALANGIQANYVGRLLAVLASDAGREVSLSGIPTGPETASSPLRQRELAVLRLIAANMTNTEIANTLVIAQSTAKWYVNQIFSKLAVQSRAEAVTRGKELKII